MPLTNAEKQRRYRERLKSNPEKKEEIRKKNLQRVKSKTKKVSEMTEEEKNQKRKLWRTQKQNQKAKKTAEKKNEKKENTINNPKVIIRLKKISVCYKKSLSTIDKLNKTIATLRKRHYRQKKIFEANIEAKNKEIEKIKCRAEVVESLIKRIYKSSNNPKKRHIQNVALNETRRHKINSKIYVANCLGISKIKKYKKVSRKKNAAISIEISKFYVRDDITRITAGKRECRTKNKMKQQIRYLTDTLKNLFKIYKSEGGKHSFATFYKYKPFYVLSPTAQSRNTCLCSKHSNINYLLKAAKSKNLIDSGITLKEILSQIACDITSFQCMHGKCQNCVNSTVQFNLDENRINEEVNWFWWQSEKHTYLKKDKNSGENKEMLTRRTTQQLKTGNLLQLIENFNKEIKLFKKHYFNMRTQQIQYQTCLKQLKSNEVLIVCDYSENYNSKLREEIQSMHFGASKNQITLHCVMVYWTDMCQSFCTVSDNPCHEPASIWAHLLPVIKYIKEKTPDINVLHIYSDGPTSQYRQKKNYFLFNMFVQKMKFDYASWSYTESGHGKGVADGIGGSVKRCLDRQVLYGHNIRNAEDVFVNINEAMKTVKTFFIRVEEIENMKKIIPSNLRPLAGNSEVHQIITTNKENEVLYRPLSCFCGIKPAMCSCYFPKTHTLLNPPLDRVPADNRVPEDQHSTEISRARALTMWLTMLGLAHTQSVPADTDTPPFNTLYKWKQIDFEFPTQRHRSQALAQRKFVPANVLPLGLEVWGSRVFVTIPSWRQGVPATLVTVPRSGGLTSPPLKPYPDWNFHKAFGDEKNCTRLTSVFRVNVDRCGRLWVLDSGQINSQDDPKQLCPPSIIVFDLDTDSLIARYEIPEQFVLQDSLFANIVVDTRLADCSDLHVYIADTWRFGLLVFRESDARFWRFSHHLFYPDPLASNYTLHGLNFQWSDGIFGLALTPEDHFGERTLYFHSMSSYREFYVLTSVLRQPWRVNNSATDFNLAGESRGLFGQASASAIDRRGVMYYGLVTRDSIGCWDTRKPYQKRTTGVVAMNSETLVFPNDIKVDHEQRQNVWVLSNRLPMFQAGPLDADDYNYRIMYADTIEAVKGTVCDPALLFYTISFS